jgi:hypothetical protein
LGDGVLLSGQFDETLFCTRNGLSRFHVSLAEYLVGTFLSCENGLLGVTSGGEFAGEIGLFDCSQDAPMVGAQTC